MFILFPSFHYFSFNFILFLMGFQNVLPPFSLVFSKTIDSFRKKKYVLCSAYRALVLFL